MNRWEPSWQHQSLALSEIEIAERLIVREPRVATVKEYAQAMRAGAEFPRVDVARIAGRLVLLDGMHRHRAAAQAEQATIPARVAKMTWAQAGTYAALANIGHGRPLSNREAKGKALELFLRDPANAKLSLREVSKALGGLVSPGTVRNYRDKTIGPLRGSETRTSSEVEAAVAQAREQRVSEQAHRRLEGLEALYERMSDTTNRHLLLCALKDTLDRMEATGNASAPSEDADLDAELLDI